MTRNYSEARNDVLIVEIRTLNEKIDDLKNDYRDLKKEMSEIHDMANRWKGGFLLVLAVGGFLGFAASFGANISKLLGIK